MHTWSPSATANTDWRAVYQIVVLAAYHHHVLCVAHESQWAGHLGVNTTYKLISDTSFGLVSSPYHPESQGALAWWHKALKSMLWMNPPCIVCGLWDHSEISRIQSCGARLCTHADGPLNTLQEKSLSTESSGKQNVSDYVSQFCEPLYLANALAKESLSPSQSVIKRCYDRCAGPCHFQVKVLALLPIPRSALSAKFSSPYDIHEPLSDTDYVVSTAERKRKNYNTLKKCLNLLQKLLNQLPSSCASIVMDSTADLSDDDLMTHHSAQQSTRLPNSWDVKSFAVSFRPSAWGAAAWCIRIGRPFSVHPWWYSNLNKSSQAWHWWIWKPVSATKIFLKK